MAELLRPLIPDGLAALPDQQRQALEVVLRLRGPSERPPDRLTLALAFQALIATVDEQHPVMVAIDDWQWLDSPSAEVVRYWCRRLHPGERVALVTCRSTGAQARRPAVPDWPAHLTTQVALGPMSVGALGRLLRQEIDPELPRSLVVCIHQATRGNPFFALELVRTLGSEAGRLLPSAQLPVSYLLTAILGRRLAKLPRRTIEALEIVAQAINPTTELVSRASGDDAAAIGLDRTARTLAGRVARDGGKVDTRPRRTLRSRAVLILTTMAVANSCGGVTPLPVSNSPVAFATALPSAGLPTPDGSHAHSGSAEPSGGPALWFTPSPPSNGPQATSGPGALALAAAVGGETLWVEPAPGVTLSGLTAQAGTSAQIPDGVTFPVGLLSFAVEGVPAGGPASVTLTLPTGVAWTTYERFGPEPGSSDAHWYDFSYDGMTGAERTADGRVVLHLVDGGRGDDDLVADGRIVDAGGPASTPNQPPVASQEYGYGRYEPFQVHLRSTSHDPDGSIVATRWTFPDGRTDTSPEAVWEATGGPAGALRRFLLSVFDGTTWSTNTFYIAVPPEMRLECGNRIEDVDLRQVEFSGSSNYWEEYGWSTNQGKNQRFGDDDLAVVWFEWDPGNGQPAIPGGIRGIHQDDFYIPDRTYEYRNRPQDPSHYTATLHAGAYLPRSLNKVELATCQTEIQFPMPVYDLFGTITFDRESHYASGDGSDLWTREETLHGTLVVAMRTDPADPDAFVDVGSTYGVDRVATEERANLGDCSPERVISKSQGVYPFDRPTEPDGSTAPSGGPDEWSAQSTIWGIQDRARGLVVLLTALFYPYQEEHTCALIELPSPYLIPEVVDSWACGDTFTGTQGLGIEGFIIDLPSGPDRVDVDCTYEGPAFLYDSETIRATGTLTIIGR